MEPKHQRIAATPETSRQLHDQTNKRKKTRTYKFNEVRQLLISLGQKGREILLINQLQNAIVGDSTPLYIARESLKKRKLTDLNSDKKWTQNDIRKPIPRVLVDRAVDHWPNTQRANSLLNCGISVDRPGSIFRRYFLCAVDHNFLLPSRLALCLRLCLVLFVLR